MFGTPVADTAHLLHLLRTELELALTQVGCARLDQLTPAATWPGDRPGGKKWPA